MNKLDKVPDESHNGESDSNGPAELNVFCDVYTGIRQVRKHDRGDLSAAYPSEWVLYTC